MVETGNEYWFADVTPERRAQLLAGTVNSIIDRHTARWQAYERFASLYRGYPGGLACKYAGNEGGRTHQLISLNGIRSCVNTAVSKVATKNRPKPMFVTNGADFDTRMLAKDQEEFVNGVLSHSRAYTAAERSFQDGAIFGEGFCKTVAEKKKIVIRALHPWEVIIDEAEGRFGVPPSIYQVTYVDKFALARAYPEFKDAIMACVPERDALAAYHIADAVGTNYADMIRLVEGWRTDERHTIAINNQILSDDPLEGSSSISKILWGSDPVVDVFGCGIAEEAEGLQVEVNSLIEEISEGHHLIKGYLWIGDGCDVVTEKINNDLRRIVRGGTVPPQYIVPQIIAPEVYEHLWNLYTKIFEITGISQANAQGAHTEGLSSSIAQRTNQDIQTERFLKTVRGYEEFVIDISGNIVRCASDDMSVRDVSGTRLGKRIEWTRAMSELDTEIRVYPGSMIPDSPAGRQAWGQDMIQLGADPGTVLETIGIQDPDSVMRRMLSRRFLIQQNIESIVRKSKYVSPEPSDDHDLALGLVNDAYHEARLDGVPEDRKLMLLKYMQVTEDFIERKKAALAAAAAQAAQPVQPVQPPTPTPQQV